MGRYQILEPGQMALPAKCISCGSNTSEAPGFKKYLDLGIDVEFYGVLYLCSECFASVALDVGYVQLQEVIASDERYVEAAVKIQDLEARNEALRSGMAALLSGAIQHTSSTSDLIDSIVSSVQESQKSRVPVESIAGTNQGSNKSKRVKGPNNVPDVAAGSVNESDSGIDFADSI